MNGIAYRAVSTGFRMILGVLCALLVTAPRFFIGTIPAYAAEANSKMILDAVAEANRFGVCSEEKESFGSDCVKTTTECDDGDWEDMVEERYRYTGTTVQNVEGEPGPYESLGYLNADWERNKGEPPGPVVRGTCYCECQANDDASVCAGKQVGTPFRVAEDLTYDQCADRCAPRLLAQKCAGSLPSLQSADATYSGSSDVSGMCFTPSECSDAKGYFESYAQCPNNGGRCVAAEPAIDLNVGFGPVKRVEGFGQYIVSAYRYMVSIVAIVATVAFVWGAFLYLIGSALPSISRGKEIMMDAVLGLVMVFASTMILRTINPATTKLDAVKVYMVNSVRFTNAQYCADLGSNSLMADAGTKPSLRPYEEVEKDQNAFNIPGSRTQCGRSYWVKDAVGSSCDGSACPNPGEACVSCSDGKAKGCLGEQRDMRVCMKALFTGSIQYRDGRYPKEVDLIVVCNHAQNTENLQTVYDNTDILDEQSLERVGVGSGQAKTDEDSAGVAGYSFDFSTSKLNSIESYCSGSKGGLRGVLLGVIYHESGLAVNDVAVLSKRNCGAKGQFDGYADGTTGVSSYNIQVDLEDFDRAMMCGMKKGKFLDDAQKTNYWSLTELRNALNGKPITCNFALSDDNAPDDPGTKFCSK